MLEDLELPSGSVKALVLREGMPGLFTDTLVYAQGIGFIRWAKLLFGERGMTERMEYELVEFNGKPFVARTVGISGGKTGKRHSVRARAGNANPDPLGRRFRRPTSDR